MDMQASPTRTEPSMYNYVLLSYSSRGIHACISGTMYTKHMYPFACTHLSVYAHRYAYSVHTHVYLRIHNNIVVRRFMWIPLMCRRTADRKKRGSLSVTLDVELYARRWPCYVKFAAP